MSCWKNKKIMEVKKYYKQTSKNGFMYLINCMDEFTEYFFEVHSKNSTIGSNNNYDYNYCRYYYFEKNNNNEVYINHYAYDYLNISKYVEKVFNERKKRVRYYNLKKQLGLVDKKQIERKRKKI